MIRFVDVIDIFVYTAVQHYCPTLIKQCDKRDNDNDNANDNNNIAKQTYITLTELRGVQFGLKS